MESKPSLEERVQHLENRVRHLEKKLDIISPDSKETLTVNPSKLQKSIEWDVLIFHKILPRLFILVFIIGVLWGFKAASDYGFLTENVKVALGYFVAAALIFLGMLQLKQKRTVLGQVLLGGSIPILMLTTFAMHQLYDITGPEFSFILNVLWIGLGLYFTFKYKSQGIGIVSSVGGVFVPFLIESTSPNIPVFVFYETILYVFFIWLALRQRYTILYYVSAVFLNIALLLFFITVNIPEEYKWISVSPIIFQQFALLSGFLKSHHFLKQQAYTLCSSIILTSLWVQAAFTDKESSIVFAAIALLYAACYYLNITDVKRAPIYIANGLIGFLLFVEMLADNLTPEVLIGSSIVYMFVSKKYKSFFHALLSGFTYIIAFFLVFDKSITAWISWEMLHWTVFIAATGYALHFLVSTKKKDGRIIYNFGVPYLAILLLMFTTLLSELLAGNAGENTERFIMSTLWIAIAVLFMVLSRPLSIRQGKYVGAGILFFTLAKIIIVDIPFVSIAVRAMMFILLGIVGLIVSRAYDKK
ncbi:DUF2339 domain-containing protein [Lederbergia citrea]|uniref:DUF2339 domain-containing protein n=1 Tax=Lederbergia citrea TaxID=2833581 RepID=A0A942UN09_9BACI|nr:DUF2339 domain-containing protein [Lederbergia citrea]MBS4206115.1 DUF2339 domain-containing protein [Lederbergia citrea]MBS4224436.1 DUF2339 domain-containing protein [Lederbergia citrea]